MQKHPHIHFTTEREYPAVKCSSYDANGVLEIFKQKVAELPEEINVILPYEIVADGDALFVAKDGKDDNAGDIAAPLATVNEALARLSGKGGKVFIREGSYTLEKTIDLGASHSGTDENPTCISAYNGEKVILTAGFPLDASKAFKVNDGVARGIIAQSMLERLNRFDAHNADDIYAIDMFALGYTADDLGAVMQSGAPALYINGTSYRLARYPNAGASDPKMGIKEGEILTYGEGDEVVKIGQVSQYASVHYADHQNDEPGWAITFDNALYRDRILAYKPYGKDDPIWTHAEVHEEWWADMCAVDLVKDERGRNVMNSRHNCSWGAKIAKGTRIYFYNMPEELDEATEYYLDRVTGILYFKPEKPIEASDVIVFTAKNIDLLTVKEASNVVVNGISFEKTVANGVLAEGCRYLLFQNCLFDNTGKDSLNIKNSLYSGAINSTFVKSGGNSSLARIECDWKGMTLDCFNFVQNCYFDRAALRIIGQRYIVSHNYFEQTNVVTGGIESIIEYNEFHRGGQSAHDGGPIYNSGFGQKRGLHVRYNHFHHLDFTMHGIYFDDLSSGNYAYGNIVSYAEGVRGDCFTVHNGCMNVITSNIFIGGRDGINMQPFYDAKVIDDVPTGYGWLCYRWPNMAPKLCLAFDEDRADQAFTNARFPMVKKYCEMMKVAVESTKREGYDPSSIYTKDCFEEVFVRSMPYNVYLGNLMVDCEMESIYPDCVKAYTMYEDNVSYKTRDDVMYTPDGEYALDTASPAFKDAPSFINMPIAKMGLFK